MDVQAEGTFGHLLTQRRSAYWMLGDLSAGWWCVLVSLPGDEAAEAWSLCCRMPLLADEESPDDVLPVVALDRKLPRYPLESPAQHRARLIDAWSIYEYAGTEYVIETQLRAAGYGPTDLIGDFGNPDIVFGDTDYFFGDLGAFVQFRPAATGPRGEPAPYRTQFWVVFNEGFHPVTGGAAPWGSWTWGDTWVDPPGSGVWALEGLGVDDYRTIIGIVKKWKPVDHVLRGFLFIINNIDFGDTGVTFGDTGILFGGAQSIDLPLG